MLDLLRHTILSPLIRLVKSATLLQDAPSIVRSNNACDVFPFSHARRTPPHKYTIHETVHRVAVADVEVITRGDK